MANVPGCRSSIRFALRSSDARRDSAPSAPGAICVIRLLMRERVFMDDPRRKDGGAELTVDLGGEGVTSASSVVMRLESRRSR